MKLFGCLYKYFFLPQQGNLASLYHIFCCLQKNLGNSPGRIVFDGEFNTTTYEAILLEVDKYAPDESSKWRRVNARFPALYKALLVELDAATRGARPRQAVSAVG